MRRRAFERLVMEALDQLPEVFQERLENVAIVVEDHPRASLLKSLGMGSDELLFGFYEGTPLTDPFRGQDFRLPDKITLYQRSFEETCDTRKEMVEEVRKTVLHEIGHHFGLEEEQLEDL